MKTTITRVEYCTLVGLMELARRHNEDLVQLERALGALLEVEPEQHRLHQYFGHVSDAVHGNHTADELLSLLKITVLEAKP